MSAFFVISQSCLKFSRSYRVIRYGNSNCVQSFLWSVTTCFSQWVMTIPTMLFSPAHVPRGQWELYKYICWFFFPCVEKGKQPVFGLKQCKAWSYEANNAIFFTLRIFIFNKVFIFVNIHYVYACYKHKSKRCVLIWMKFDVWLRYDQRTNWLTFGHEWFWNDFLKSSTIFEGLKSIWWNYRNCKYNSSFYYFDENPL